MLDPKIVELIGFLASFLVLVSLLMTSVVKLRIINSIGAIVFVWYALTIRSYPTAVMNACLVVVNGYFLWRMSRSDAIFSIESAHGDDSALRHFLQSYRSNVTNYFPGWHWTGEEDQKGFLVYIDATPVGCLVGKEIAPGVLQVEVDYAAPAHRDTSVGKYIYRRLPALGIHELHSRCGNDSHNKYLESVGFVRQGDEYVKKLG